MGGGSCGGGGSDLDEIRRGEEFGGGRVEVWRAAVESEEEGGEASLIRQ